MPHQAGWINPWEHNEFVPRDNSAFKRTYAWLNETNLFLYSKIFLNEFNLALKTNKPIYLNLFQNESIPMQVQQIFS